jgi:hypothetical protein
MNLTKAQYNLFRNSHKWKIPSYTTINTFSIKLIKHGISSKIIDELLLKYKAYIDTNIISIDSTFIPNKCMNKKTNKHISINAFYKSKYGVKLTAIVNEIGIPLHISIDGGSEHDVKIASRMLISTNINIVNKLMLCDTGYDSIEFKNILTSKKCKYIIPCNNRNKYTDDMKKICLDHIENVKQYKKAHKNEVKNIKTKKPKNMKICIDKLNVKLVDTLELITFRKNKLLKEAKDTSKKDKKHKYIFNSMRQQNIYKKRSFVEHFNAM